MGDVPDAGARALPRMVSDELSYPFDFEKKKRTLRTARAARPGLVTLLHRLAVQIGRAHV